MKQSSVYCMIFYFKTLRFGKIKQDQQEF